MAGGSGTRLRPLTMTMPKPLVPIANKSALLRIAEHLSKHGIKRAAATTFYLSEQIEYAASQINNLEIKCFRETKPLGTAGSVRGILPFLSEDNEDSFLVISGDAVCKIDLTSAFAFHRQRDADITIILSKAEDPSEYGVVLCSSDGRIEKFIEKPGVSQTFADTINTGIYIIKREIIEALNEGEPYDFGRDLFPAALYEGKKLFGCRDNNYWCDVGDLNAFYSCNIKIAEEEGKLDKNYNIIGENCFISNNSNIKNCVIFDNVKIGEGCYAESSIICENTNIGAGAVIKKGCVIGAGSLIGNNAVLKEDSIIQNNTVIKNGAAVMGTIAFGEIKADIFSDSGMVFDISSVTTEYIVRIGAAVGGAVKEPVGVMNSGNEMEKHIGNALLCGISSCNIAMDIKTENGGYHSLASFSAWKFNLGIVLLVICESKTVSIKIFDKNSLYPDRAFERSVAASMITGNTKNCLNINYSPSEIKVLDGVEFLYKTDLQKNIFSFNNMSCNILEESRASKLLCEILSEKGCTVTCESNINIKITDNGASCVISNNDTIFDMWHIIAVILQDEIANSAIQKIAFPYHAPPELEKIAKNGGVDVIYYTSCPYDNSEYEARKLTAEQLWTRDAFAAVLKFFSVLYKRKVSLSELYNSLPVFYSTKTEYQANKIKLSDLGIPAQEGVVINYTLGIVKVIPKRNGVYRLFANAAGTEAAEEILSLTKKKLDMITKNKNNI